MFASMGDKGKTITPKKGSKNWKQEGSMYDKIMRENLRKIFLPLVAARLNIEIREVEELPNKQETTVERESDALLRIETVKGFVFLLHLEFQTTDDLDMIYRISEYHGLELRKYGLPIKHIVIYLGVKKPKMRTSLKPNEIFSSFELVNVHNFDPNKWLSSQIPEEIIMAVLSDYSKENAELILQAIIKRLREVCLVPKDLDKYVQQLIILSKLRNLENKTIQIIRHMPITFKLEDSYFFQLAKEKYEIKLQEKLAELKAIATRERTEVEAKAAIAKAEIAKASKAAKAAEMKAAKAKAVADAKVEKAKIMAAAKAEKAAKEKLAIKAKARQEKTVLLKRIKEEEKAKVKANIKQEKEKAKLKHLLNQKQKEIEEFKKSAAEAKILDRIRVVKQFNIPVEAISKAFDINIDDVKRYLNKIEALEKEVKDKLF